VAELFTLLDEYTGTRAEKEAICQAWDAARGQLKSTPRADRSLVGRLETRVRENPEAAFRFADDGYATLEGYAAGRFRCASLNSLAGSGRGGRLKLWVVVGLSPVTDIGALQALAPPGSLFQVASQFNCLEAPGPRLARVSDYFFDPTQGPRASISAFPGTLLRHYRVPFEQKDPAPQLNLLRHVALPGVAEVDGGYLLADNIAQPTTFAALLHDHFDEIEVGLHEGVQVVLGDSWDGQVEGAPRIAQVFISTIAAGGYSRVNVVEPVWLDIVTQLQRAAYLGTLRAAAATGQRRAVLTLIGGGVFGNPLEVIWKSIVWACRQVEPTLGSDLTVIVNARALEGLDLERVEAVCQQAGGEVLLASGDATRING